MSAPLPAVVEFANHLKEIGARRVLDLGSGSGRHTLLIASWGFQVVALDVSETALTELVRRTGLVRLQNVTAVRDEVGTLPFIDGYFDAIVCTNVLHHGPAAEIRRSFAEARRVLRKGGLALFVVVSDKDFRFGRGKKLEPKTFVFTDGEEKGITHHFFGEDEFRVALVGFRVVRLWEELLPEGRIRRAHFYAIVKKR